MSGQSTTPKRQPWERISGAHTAAAAAALVIYWIYNREVQEKKGCLEGGEPRPYQLPTSTSQTKLGKPRGLRMGI
jgi:hypothetical protein